MKQNYFLPTPETTRVVESPNSRKFRICCIVAMISLCVTLLAPWTHLQNVYTFSGYLDNISKPYYHIVEDDKFGMNSTFFKLHSSKVTHIPENFSISGSQVCAGGVPGVLFVVPSVASAASKQTRVDIRETWASAMYGNPSLQTSSTSTDASSTSTDASSTSTDASSTSTDASSTSTDTSSTSTSTDASLTSTRLAFFFGSSNLSEEEMQSLKNESDTFGDIVVGDFNDTYENLSLKMAVIITWVASRCPHVKAMVKVDMDTFVNVDILLNLIDQLPAEEHPSFVFGNLHNANHPEVMRTGVWSVTETLYPFEFYPKYVYGHSYVLSGPAVKLLAHSFPYFPIIPNEDAFVTGVMAVVLNITRFYHQSFADEAEINIVDRFDKNILTSALVDSETRWKLWDSLKKRKKKDYPA
ncbi:beta-1,3-galactosyltransferase 1-like [Elysia marginata]|uniref:Hexosyltransferase n=1 Tax=Elysia marginata TaxID=1093978 RepID=A0AAV4J788_9GAST|nr:beta-1,3-galactosyltransferase 1-like [Elysia marginata]